MTEAAVGIEDSGQLVRAANLAFYRAFETLDPTAMARVWSQQAPVLCVHPGWEPLATVDEVLQSWSAIFANTGYVEVEFEETALEVRGAIGWVHGVERLRQAVSGAEARGSMVATNIFRREGHGWRLIVHHASPVVR